MKMKFCSLIAGAALFALTGAANAAQPLALSDTQMDGVTAGAAALANAAAQAIGEFDAVTHTETLTNTNIATTPHFALAATLAQAAAASVLTISQSTANTNSAATLP